MPLQLTNVVLVCKTPPSLSSGYSLKGNFTVKLQAAVLFRGGVGASRGPERLIHSLQPDARPVVPHIFLFFFFLTPRGLQLS